MGDAPYPPSPKRQHLAGQYFLRQGLRVAGTTLCFEDIDLVDLAAVRGLAGSDLDRLRELIDEIEGCPDAEAIAGRLTP